MKWRSIQSTASIVSGDVYQHGVRLAANLIMTRLLHPEAFGLMLIVNVMLIALEMLSDVGIRGAVILNSKKNETRYLNTAWTMQMIRGGGLTLIAFSLAVPLSWFYDNPELIPLFLVSGFSPLIASLASPKIFIYQRDIKASKLVLINAISQTLAVIITIIWLMIEPTVWALIGHRLLISAIHSAFSYILIERFVPKWSWDKGIIKEILGFGKWIFLSTALTYISIQGDKIIMSKWLDTEMLGIYSIASVFAMLADLLQRSLSQKLLFPIYSEAKYKGKAEFNKNILKVRFLLMGITTPIILFLAVFGDQLIMFLYDPRYHQAGWILQIISAGSVFSVISTSLIPIFLAHGDSKKTAFLQGCRGVILFALIISGGYLLGLKGLIIGAAVVPAVIYPIVNFMVRKYGVDCLRLDVTYIIFSVSVISLGWYIRGFPNPGV